MTGIVGRAETLYVSVPAASTVVVAGDTYTTFVFTVSVPPPAEIFPTVTVPLARVAVPVTVPMLSSVDVSVSAASLPNVKSPSVTIRLRTALDDPYISTVPSCPTDSRTVPSSVV